MRRPARSRSALAVVVVAMLAVTACGNSGDPDEASPASSTQAPPASADGSAPSGTGQQPRGTPAAEPERGGAGTPPEPAPQASPPAAPRPEWLGERVLPEGPRGFGDVRPTPPELVDRRLRTPEHLPPPTNAAFQADISPVPRAVAARSTWSPACPVDLDDLRYVTLTFWGFDQQPHTGELLVHASVAQDIVGVFRRLHEARFPIEEMRITSSQELNAPPTGDGNDTSAFVCRPSTGSSSWSEHAKGLAVDINPFHNPYVNGDVVLPELASAYVDRSNDRPGMIQPGDEVVSAFAAIGWEWGGYWSSSKDWMHFSRSGR